VSHAPASQNPPGRYNVEFAAKARKQLRKINARDRQRIMSKIDELAENPRPDGCLKLSGDDNQWRIRVGDFRVVYEIYDADLRVFVIRAAHRKDVYD
jgi:mRNA interferase RelE/StbE